MKAGETHQLRADCIALEGESVSRLANAEAGKPVLTVHTPGVFPGELASVHVEAISRHHPRAFARVKSIDEAHPARRDAPCPNHPANGGKCSGCALMQLSEAAQREAKRQMLEMQYGLTVSEVEPSSLALGYRLSSKRVALHVKSKLVLGSFARGSHAPAPMPGCLVDHPRLVQVFTVIERECQFQRIAAYDERTGQGDLRYVWAKTNGEQVIVTLVVANEVSRARELLPDVLKVCDGVLVSVQSGNANSMRGEQPELLRGQSEVAVSLLGQHVEVGALGFMQPNPEVAERAYWALVSPPEGAENRLAFDLYAGAGITTRALAQHFAEVVACEAYPESAAQLGVEPSSVEDFLARELQRDVPRTPGMVVANPPRKGLGEPVTRALSQLAAPELRIMSCGPEGLARDLARLTSSEGGYVLVELRAFDTLPQTPHVELVARLTRA